MVSVSPVAEKRDRKVTTQQYDKRKKEGKTTRRRKFTSSEFFCLFCLSRTVFEDNLAAIQQVARSSGRRLTTRIKWKFLEDENYFAPGTPSSISFATAVCIWQQLPTLETPGKSQSCHVCLLHSPKHSGGLSV